MERATGRGNADGGLAREQPLRPVRGTVSPLQGRPYRRHVEEYTLRKLTGPLRREAALDLACGEGFYSRRLRAWGGAGAVVGVDLSTQMIELARRQEAARPLGIDYLVRDVRGLDLGRQFDLVFAAFLFNHARDSDEFLEMAGAVVRHLAPGGRLVAVISRGDQPVSAYPKLTKYGFSKSTPGELVEGVPITITFHEDYWRDFLEEPGLIFLEARR